MQVQNKEAEIGPLKEYTMLGNIRKEKKSVWHYTDRFVIRDFLETLFLERLELATRIILLVFTSIDLTFGRH